MGSNSVISIVSEEELQHLWDENRVSEKRAMGIFQEIVSRPKPANDPRMAGAASVIVRLYTANGFHIGTIHEIIYSDGRPSPHSHPKDYTLRDCSRVRVLNKQEVASQPRKRRQRKRALVEQID